MAITVETNTTESITLEEYFDYVSSEVAVYDVDEVLNSATALRALANNRSFLVARLNQELADWKNFQTENSYTAPTITLGGGEGFFVRANMWVPMPESAAEREWDRKLYAYEVPHDHNFSFLTVGYLGSGYGTTIYEYDPKSVVGFPGEHVDLKLLEKTSLYTGKVMYYRASQDIHSQEHPDEFSVSINLLIIPPNLHLHNQYFFDIESQTIKGFVPNPGSGRVTLCHLARYVGDGLTVNLLESLAKQHTLPRLRWEAYDSLSVLAPSGCVEILERAANDPDPFVEMHARAALDKLISGTSP